MRSATAATLLPMSRFPRLVTPHFDEAAALYSRFAAPVKLHRGNSKLGFAWRSNGVSVGPVFLSSSAYSAGFTAQSEGPGDVFVLSIPLGSAGSKGSSGKQSTLACFGSCSRKVSRKTPLSPCHRSVCGWAKRCSFAS